MKLMPHKGMAKDESRMEADAPSTRVLGHSLAGESQPTTAKIAFGNQGTTGRRIIALFGRRSPGRKALFSSIHPAPASWTAPAGFTLIEVLLALMVSGIVLVVISGVFAGALHLQKSSADTLDQVLPIERAFNVMRKDLKNTIAPGGMLAGPLQSGSALGGVDSNEGMQFYTTTGQMLDNVPWSEIQKVSYALQTPADSYAVGKDLIRTVTRNLLTTGTEDDDEQFLMTGVESLKFSFFDGGNWLDSWDDTTETNLPMAIRVTLQMAPANDTATRQDPMQLLVPLMVQVHTNGLDSDSGTNSTTGAGA